MVAHVLFACSYGFACVVQPGPFQLFLLNRTLTHGWKRTLPAACAPLLSDGPIILLTVLFIRSLPDWLEPVLYATGGVYLLLLAAHSWRDRRTGPTDHVPEGTPARTVLAAALVNFLNPNPWLGWSLVLGPMLVSSWRESPLHGLALLLGFYGTMITGTVILIGLFERGGRFTPRMHRALLSLATLALVAFGIYALARGAAEW